MTNTLACVTGHNHDSWPASNEAGTSCLFGLEASLKKGRPRHIILVCFLSRQTISFICLPYFTAAYAASLLVSETTTHFPEKDIIVSVETPKLDHDSPETQRRAVVSLLHQGHVRVELNIYLLGLMNGINSLPPGDLDFSRESFRYQWTLRRGCQKLQEPGGNQGSSNPHSFSAPMVLG